MAHPAALDPAQRERILARLRARPALWRQYVEDAASGDPDFGLWLFTLDASISRHVGLTHCDLTDQPWGEEYDAGTDPAEYAGRVLLATRPVRGPDRGRGPTLRAGPRGGTAPRPPFL